MKNYTKRRQFLTPENLTEEKKSTNKKLFKKGNVIIVYHIAGM